MFLFPREASAAPAAGSTRNRRLLCAGFVAVFLVHALNYGYFFVDDEAISFVYAQNVLDGHGLAYNPDDGPAEGYSNFLKVWIDVLILGLTTAAGMSKLWALVLAKLLAFACAVTLVVVTFRILSRRPRQESWPLVAGMAFLTLAGPLAVWSCSGLETTLFALMTAVLVGALLDADRADRRNDRLILLSVAGMVLCRIDGFIWAGALVAPFLIFATPARRRELVVRVVLPAVALFAAYHAWRIWYFGELLPMPIYSKVLYKLGPRETLISFDPAEGYLVAFLRAFHWIPVGILGLGLAAAVLGRTWTLLALAAGVGLIAVYLSIVGDWMFGFRFFVPLVAPLAVLTAAGFSLLTRWRPRAAVAAVAVWVAALGGTSFEFFHAYHRMEGPVSWLAHPSLDPERHFAGYYQIYREARAHAGPGDTIAFNQAGFVPFMLGARNVDDLGISTKFNAKLPTTDVVYTEVGRYSPLTASPALRASEAYTIARAPRLVLAIGSNLRAANRGRYPQTVLGGTYRLLFSTRTVAGYEPAGHTERVHDPRQYLENLAHISRLRRASINGRPLGVPEYRALRYLYGRAHRLTFDELYTADFTFSDSAENVYAFYIGGIRSEEAASMIVTLRDEHGRETYRNTLDLAAGERRQVHVTFGERLAAAALSMAIASDAPGPHVVDLEDVRVQGQTAALKRFVREHLDFD